jgi:putative ABC transport system ATP-binding protein
MTSERMLDLSGITCCFADSGGHVVTALDDVSLGVDRGRMVAVMGPSGSGKSTLLHVACGLVLASRGTVRIAGEAPPRWSARRRLAVRPGGHDLQRWWARQRREAIGVVHQRLNLVPALRAVDNVALPLRLDGADRPAARKVALAALAEVGAAELADSDVDRLSTGQQQRVALARAIVGDRSLVLADEPTASLDTVGAEQIAELLARLAAGGRAVLMVTHDSRLATWADEVLVLRDGRIVDRVEPGKPGEPGGPDHEHHDDRGDGNDEDEVAVP